MAEKPERKQWASPKILHLGKLTDIEQNNQISAEMKQYLLDLRNSLLTSSEKEKGSKTSL